MEVRWEGSSNEAKRWDRPCPRRDERTESEDLEDRCSLLGVQEAKGDGKI